MSVVSGTLLTVCLLFLQILQGEKLIQVPTSNLIAELCLY